MSPGVPFALLGVVLLLSVAAWTGLAAAVVVSGGRTRVAAALVVTGVGLLVATDVLTASRSGSSSSDALALARAAGLLLVAGGLGAGRLSSAAPEVSGAAGIVVPLGASLRPAAATGGAGVLAAVSALRAWRDLAGGLVALGLAATGASAALAPAARDGRTAAVLELGLRGVGSLLVLAGLLAMARRSLLAKVVAASLAGVLVMAAAAVGVVGTTVAAGYQREQASVVADAARGRLELIRQQLDRLRALTPVLAGVCAKVQYACASTLLPLTEETSEDFAAVVPVTGDPFVVGGRAPLTASELVGLAGSDLVQQVRAGGPSAVRTAVGRPVRLLGATPGLALVVAQPLDRPTPTAPADVFLYGNRLSRSLVDNDSSAGGFGYSLLVGDFVVASNLPGPERAVVAAAARSAGPLAPDGVTVPADGDRPTVHLRPLGSPPVGVLAMSRSARESLQAEQQALSALLLTALAATAGAAALALVVGRRTVQPVRRLTAAAGRVSAGDLTTRTQVTGRDEVGVLARAFDTMTGSLDRLTTDLRDTAGRLETVLASMSDGLLATDADGRVTSANRAAAALTGVDDPVGRPLEEVLDLRADGAALRLDAGTVHDAPAQVHRPDGDATPVRVAVAPLGESGGLVVVLRDTTREREVERMKTEFLSNVSHELRTPLTPIRGYADLLVSRSGLSPQQVTAFAGVILGEALKMNRVVDLLVDVAAIEAGRVMPQPVACSPRVLLDERLARWRERVPERAGDLRRRVAAGLPAVHVDPEWLGKVLDELIDNAVKHTPSGTPVTLAAGPAPDGERVRVAVRDTGPGIDPAESERLFTSFEQRDGSATRRVGGLGLGLSFVRRVAQDAGWPLTVTSPAAAGRGAEFALDLPTSQEPVRPRASGAARLRARVPGRDRSPARPARRPAL